MANNHKKLMDVVDDVNPYSTYLDKEALSKVDDFIDTGSLALNAIISGSLYKGVPFGRITQFAGPSMVGKTYFIQKIIANAQKKGMNVVVFDSENAIDPEGAKGFGIDISKIKYVPTTTIENTRNAIFKFLKKVAEAVQEGKAEYGDFLIVIDSLANMESELGESRMSKDSTSADMGTFAKSIKSLLKTCVNWSKLTKVPVVVTNEVYDDPSCMYPPLEKNMPGGRSAVFKPSVTVQIARRPTKDDDGKTIDNTLSVGQKSYSGSILRCYTAKNRLIKPSLEVELYLSYSTGLDRYYGLLGLMKGLGVVVLKGKTYEDWQGNKLGFYKNWRKDEDLWENTLLPELEKRIQEEWSYKNDTPYDEEDVDEEELAQEDEIENPLDKLKNLKSKVKKKIEEIGDEDE